MPNIYGCASSQFKCLMATLFLGAFNDNLFKTIVSLLVLSHFVSEEHGILFLSLTAGLFALPYILFSAIAGFFADRYSKTTVMKLLKLLEAAVMTLALVAFWLESSVGLMVAVFLMGAQSALFSPAKYGSLPEMLPPTELARGNGYTEFYTFLAIISGTAIAGFTLQISGLNPGVIPLVIAALGVLTALRIGDQPVANPERHFTADPIGPHLRRIKEITLDRGLYLSVLGAVYFYFIGTTFQLNILVFAKQTLVVGEVATSLLLAALAIGIGTGSLIAGRASEGKVELGLVPIGGVGLCIFTLFLPVAAVNYYITAATVLLLGLSGGVFIVPIHSYLQANSPADKLGGYLAASNFFIFIGIVLASALYWVAVDIVNLSPSSVFVGMGIVSFFAAIYLVRLNPEMLARCINWILLHLFYKITIKGAHHIPPSGGALLVSNHVSYIDAQLILAALHRPVRFIMYRPIYEHWLIHPVAKLNQAIPIAGGDGKDQIAETLKSAAKLIEQGELVGIFAEGKITRNGEIEEFRTGLETIMSHVEAPIIPVCLKGVWGSIFSYEGGGPIFKLPKRIPYPLEIEFGAPLPGETKATAVREVIAAMHDRVGHDREGVNQ